jgi:CheY-like chemotaxis protein
MLTYIIDDEAISLFLTEQVLRHECSACSICTFTDAKEALQYIVSSLGTEIPEIILVDLNMPGMNGWQFLDALSPYTAALAGRCLIYILTSSLALGDTMLAKNYSFVQGIIHKPLYEEDVQTIWHTAKQSLPSMR